MLENSSAMGFTHRDSLLQTKVGFVPSAFCPHLLLHTSRHNTKEDYEEKTSK